MPHLRVFVHRRHDVPYGHHYAFIGTKESASPGLTFGHCIAVKPRCDAIDVQRSLDGGMCGIVDSRCLKGDDFIVIVHGDHGCDEIDRTLIANLAIDLHHSLKDTDVFIYGSFLQTVTRKSCEEYFSEAA